MGTNDKGIFKGEDEGVERIWSATGGVLGRFVRHRTADLPSQGERVARREEEEGIEGLGECGGADRVWDVGDEVGEVFVAADVEHGVAYAGGQRG